MDRLNYNDRKFWEKVFIATIEAGGMSPLGAAAMADESVKELQKRHRRRTRRNPPAERGVN
jgi:hypothetical protein